MIILLLFLATFPGTEGGLLGAGTGTGSCAAYPYRAPQHALDWPNGCPQTDPCCSEYGYCQKKADWFAKKFRDCNGNSNGIRLPAETCREEAKVGNGGVKGCSGFSGGGGNGFSGGGGNGFSSGGGTCCGGGGGNYYEYNDYSGGNQDYNNYGGSGGYGGNGGCGNGCGRRGRNGGRISGKLGRLVNG